MKYPWWLSLWYQMGPIVRPIHRLRQRLVVSAPSPAFRVVLFHDIPDTERAGFERFIDYLSEHYAIITPEEVAASLAESRPIPAHGRTPVLLTFDDGFESQCVVAQEVLGPRNIRAVFFLCPAIMDLPLGEQRREIAARIFDGGIAADELPEDMRLISWDSVKVLIDSGHTIGSHTGLHRRLSSLDPVDREKEIIDSKDLLESRLGAAVDWFAYPFGDIDSIDSNSMELIGEQYRYCCSGVAGPNDRTTHCLGIRRQNIDLGLPFTYQLFVMEGGMDSVYISATRRYQSLLPVSK